jgi:hypothetical protein
MSGDVAGYGVHRVRTSWVSPSRGLPASLYTLLAHVDSLSSHLNGEEGVALFCVGTCRWYNLETEEIYLVD